MNQDTKTLLRISRKHVNLSKKSKVQVKVDHAIVSIIFSAIAVESALNLAICLPVLRVKNRAQRIYFGTLLTNFFSANIPKKLTFLFRIYPTLKTEKELRKNIQDLFTFRNKVVHSTPTYSEARDPPEVFEYMEEEGLTAYSFNENVLSTKPTLHMKGVSNLFVDMLSLAEGYYKVAEEFVNLLGELNFEEVEDSYLDYMIQDQHT